MNKVKTNSGAGAKKITPSTGSLKSEQKDKINLEEKIDKLTIKTKNVNGLLNGVEHNLTNKVSKKNRKNNKNLNKSVDLEDKKYNSLVVDNLEEINNINVANGKNTTSHRLESVPSTSDTTKKCDQSDLKLTKSKSKSKKAEIEKPCSSSSSSKSDTKSKTDELDSSDFDITAYIRSKYGSDIKEAKEAEREEVGESEKMTDTSVEKVENVELESEESLKTENPKIEYVQYQSELQMPMIMKIIQKDLSEPYSIYTYRYFIHNWPNLCFLVSFMQCLI